MSVKLLFYIAYGQTLFYLFRRQELQELRKLQRAEQRQMAILHFKQAGMVEQMVNKFASEQNVS